MENTAEFLGMMGQLDAKERQIVARVVALIVALQGAPALWIEWTFETLERVTSAAEPPDFGLWLDAIDDWE